MNLKRRLKYNFTDQTIRGLKVLKVSEKTNKQSHTYWEAICKHDKVHHVHYRTLLATTEKDYQCNCTKVDRKVQKSVYKKKYRQQPHSKLRRRIRKRLRQLKVPTIPPEKELLGCSYKQLVKYIESNFKPGMDWNNYGTKWELDHILPLAMFDLNNYTEVCIASHFLNFQPLWKSEHKEKSKQDLLWRSRSLSERRNAIAGLERRIEREKTLK